MKTAIILHGMPNKEEYHDPRRPSPSNAHWLAWIQRQLITNDILAQTPEMPEPYDPDYEKWRKVFEYFPIDKETILVGHSCGGGFLLRWLSENKVEVGKVALVAPWIDPRHLFAPKIFANWELDGDFVRRTSGTCLFISSDDEQDELDTAELLKREAKGLQVKQFIDHGHFCYSDMKTEEFPELAEFLLS